MIDYVLNVAVSVAAGVAALTSAFPGLLPYSVWLCLMVLALVTVVNLRGIADSARAFIVPTAIYVGAILLVIVAGLVRGEPAAPVEQQVTNLQTVGPSWPGRCAGAQMRFRVSDRPVPAEPSAARAGAGQREVISACGSCG
ncbi:hypothetical protein [Nonomuraea rubra]|uniref:hypothetical protein n=1 Tax=Nonomuraea rubra TaxID=46180 RepID=UPI0033E5C53A